MDKTLQLNTSTIHPKKGHQTDQYQGSLDPKTRLRHGQGTYHYNNKYFAFIGNYQQGVKQGKGTLKLGDGTVINGTFQNNQLDGYAEIFYADKSVYKGNLKAGEKHGKGYFKSIFEEYEGNYQNNKKEGFGKYKTRLMEIEGQFKNNKPDGKCTLKKYNYFYDGCFQNGVKNGSGVEECRDIDNSFKYSGEFCDDKFEGKGKFQDTKCGYFYEGEFKDGKPVLYPNQFRVYYTTLIKQQNGDIQQTQKALLLNPLEYEVESQMAYNIFIQSCYQGPEELDPVQPTAEEIQKMTKDWQNQNKKNKNPPPMPDFNQPRMIKPELVIIEQQSQRPLEMKILKENGEEITLLKVDYREQIKKKKQQNEVMKAELLKKAEEEGGKKGGKKDPKTEGDFKINIFNDSPTDKDKVLIVKNEKGAGLIEGFQLPDDFPQGTYEIIISSSFNSLGMIKEFKKEIIIKAKASGKKK